MNAIQRLLGANVLTLVVVLPSGDLAFVLPGETTPAERDVVLGLVADALPEST